jgi:hypothetical protein
MLAIRQRRTVRTAGALAAGAALVITALPASAGQALAAGRPAVKPVAFAGYTFEVPRSWPVIDLARHQRACVRFDRHAVYVGQPGRNELCPAALIGTTEALLFEQAPAGPARSSVENPVARQITVRAPRISVTATFGTDPAQIFQILRSAALPEPDIQTPGPAWLPAPGQPAGQAGHGKPAPLPAGVTNYRGLGFDACAAPSYAYMRAWRRHSRYRAVGILIGGSDRACAQPNLTRGWLRLLAREGWHFFPLYVGPQAAYGELSSPARQGAAAATDAVARAQQLGFRRHAPLYYDMEGYPAGQNSAALRFFSAWTARIHRLGYASGVYSSALSGIADLARHYYCRGYAMPDVIDVGRWNGKVTTKDWVLRRREWAGHRRLHQFTGNIVQAFGGDAINIDQDYLNVDLHRARHRGRVAAGTRARHC